MTRTIGQTMAAHDILLADELLRDIEVPVLIGPQRQGDVGIWPKPQTEAERRLILREMADRGLEVAPGAFPVSPLTESEKSALRPVTADGITVVRGDATGNTHRLFAHQGLVEWAFTGMSIGDPSDVRLGVLRIAEGAVADLIHDDEHGVNAIGPGTYRLTGKREQADIVRRVAD